MSKKTIKVKKQPDGNYQVEVISEKKIKTMSITSRFALENSITQKENEIKEFQDDLNQRKEILEIIKKIK